MVLNSIYPTRDPNISDGGYLSVTEGSNLANTAIIDGDIREGSLFSMFDLSIATSCGTSAGSEGGYTRNILIDLKKKKNKVVISAYYSAHVIGATSVVVTWATSLDNSTWTDVETATNVTPTTEVFKNWSEEISTMRYLRFNVVVVNAGSSVNGGRIYNLQITQS